MSLPPQQNPPAPTPAEPEQVADDDRITGVPGLRTWRAVYLLVTIVFVIYVVLLTAMMKVYS